MRIALLALLATLLATSGADACPASSNPCLKYRRVVPSVPVVTIYQRSVRGFPTRIDRKSIAQFLADGAWIPISNDTTPGAQLTPPTLRFVSPANAGRARAPTLRIVLIRQIERRNGTTFVDIDGDFYSLSRCEDARRTTCLSRVGMLPEELESEGHFATPP